MPFEFFGKKIENDEIVEKFSDYDDLPMHILFKNGDILPLISWVTIWDDYEVATLNKLKEKKVWKYNGIDNKKNYENNLKSQPEDWYYRNNEVNYTLNSYGYRTREFDEIDWENSIVMFGCSHVFCSGVDDKHTVSRYLEKITGKTVVNMGIPGSSIFSTLYTSHSVKTNFPKPKAVIFSWTSLDRITMIKPFGIKSYGKWNIGKQFYEKNQNAKSDFIIKNLTYISLARSIWKDCCDFYEYTHFNEISSLMGVDFFDYYGKIDWGRDILHHGPKTNLKIALNIASKIDLK